MEQSGKNGIILSYQAGIYLFKVNNGNTKTMREICLKSTTMTPKRRNWLIVLVLPILTLNQTGLQNLEK